MRRSKDKLEYEEYVKELQWEIGRQSKTRLETEFVKTTNELLALDWHTTGMECFSMAKDYYDGQWIDGEFVYRKGKRAYEQAQEDVFSGVSAEFYSDEEGTDSDEDGTGKKKCRGLGFGMASSSHTRNVEIGEEESEDLVPTASARQIAEWSQRRQRDRAETEPKVNAPLSSLDRVSAGTSSLGVFQRHGGGIGMKLLEEMGYEGGRLGKNAQGVAAPIAAKPILLNPGLWADTVPTLVEMRGPVRSVIRRFFTTLEDLNALAGKRRFELEYAGVSEAAHPRGRKTDTDSASKQTNDGDLRFGEVSQQLLWGIPDHITEDIITPKLSLTTLRILSWVNRPWKQVLQRRLDAKVRSLATETDVLVESRGVDSNSLPFNLRCKGFCIFSLADGFAYELPPLPNVGTEYAASGFPHGCRCAFLNGKVYALGGEKYDGSFYVPSDEVYVMDLAGLRQWEQCKRMQYARRWTDGMHNARGWTDEFGVYAIGGKIYVSGGQDKHGWHVDVIEVYDVETSTWHQMEQSGLKVKGMIPGFEDAFRAGFEMLKSADRTRRSPWIPRFFEHFHVKLLKGLKPPHIPRRPLSD